MFCDVFFLHYPKAYGGCSENMSSVRLKDLMEHAQNWSAYLATYLSKEGYNW